MSEPWLDSTAICIVGERGSGKTALAYDLLSRQSKPVYVFNNPKPQLITDLGWRNMRRLEEMYDLSNVCVWIDEPQLTIPKLDKRANEGLQRLLSIARHRDLTLIISTCDTRWVTRALESYIDVWIVKDIEPMLVKQGSIVKNIIKRFVMCDVDEFRLEPNQYLVYARNFPELGAGEERGLQTFERPEFFTEQHSKPYSVSAPKSATNGASEPRQELVVVGNMNGGGR